MGRILKTAFGMARYIIAAPIVIVISALAWGAMIFLAASLIAILVIRLAFSHLI
jgi:hypothetical protein